MVQSHSWEGDLCSDSREISRILWNLKVHYLIHKCPPPPQSQAISFQSIPEHRTSWGSFLILSSHLCLSLPGGLFHSGFHTKTLYTSILDSTRVTGPANLFVLDFITRQIIWVQTLSNYIKQPNIDTVGGRTPYPAASPSVAIPSTTFYLLVCAKYN